MPQNRLPARLRWPQTPQTAGLEPALIAREVSSAASSASVSAASRSAASIAAAMAPGLGRSGCRLRKNSSRWDGPAGSGSRGKLLCLASFLSLSTDGITQPSGHSSPAGGLPAGKLDLAFGFSGDAVARCRTISPPADGLDNMAVPGQTFALQDERTVDAAIGPNDEAHPDSLALAERSEERIRCGQGLWRLNILTRRGCADMRHGDKLSRTSQSSRSVAFMLFERLPAGRQRSADRIRRSGYGQEENCGDDVGGHESYAFPRNADSSEPISANPMPL